MANLSTVIMMGSFLKIFTDYVEIGVCLSAFLISFLTYMYNVSNCKYKKLSNLVCRNELNKYLIGTIQKNYFKHLLKATSYVCTYSIYMNSIK